MMRYAAYLSFENARPRTGHFGKQVPSGPVSTERRMGSRRSGSPSAVQSHRQHQSRSLAIVRRQRHLLLWHAGTTKPPVMTTTTPVFGNARPADVGRNTVPAGGVASLDLLYSHDFRLTKDTADEAKILSAGLSSFNVLNHTSFTSYIGALSSPLFRQPAAALAGRQIQLSVGFQF
jgi:hypothetical protein